MRLALPCLLAAAASCGPPPAPRLEPVVKAKRDLTVRLETDSGAMRLVVDGRERLVTPPNRAYSVSVNLEEGAHALLLRGEPAEYGGMGVSGELTTGGANVLTLACPRRCDAAKLAAWARNVKIHSGCTGSDVSNARAEEAPGGGFEIRVTVQVLSAAERTARGCM